MARAKRPKRAHAISATDAQNNFGEVLARVTRGDRVVITRYHRPEAVVLSISEYETLIGADPVDLAALEQDFEAAVARMQSAQQRNATEALFSMSGVELGAVSTQDPDES